MAHSRDLVVAGDDAPLFLTERSPRTQPDLAPPAGPRGDLVGYSLALLIVGLFACLVVRDQRFHAPVGWDEWLTVEGYTWVGVTEDGEQRHVRRVEDFEAIPNPSLRNLAIGFIARSDAGPSEQSRHPQRLLNIALAGRRTAVMSRIPALVGAMVFGLVMFHLCWTILGWRRAAFRCWFWPSVGRTPSVSRW
jgi:hypothetical protein